MMDANEINTESSVGAMNTNGYANGKSNGHSATMSGSSGTVDASRENDADFSPAWSAPLPKKRGRKPGASAALRKAKEEKSMATITELAGDATESRRRKRITEVLVGEQIRRLRLESGLSQEELGRSSHMSTSYISRLETNEVNPTVDALNRIVRVFGLTIDGLLNLDTKANTILNSEDLDPEIRVWLFKLKGKKVSARTKHIIQVVIDEELRELNREA